MSHINVIDTDTTVRKVDTTHGLHINSRGKMRLSWPLVVSMCGGHVPCRNRSIPVTTYARVSPFFRLRSRAHRCLTYIECTNLCSKGLGKIVDSLNSLNIFHQNIRKLRNKNDKLINSFIFNSINSHTLCSSKHHMEEWDLLNLTLSSYSLGSSYYQTYRKEECVFFSERIKRKKKKITPFTVQSRLWKFVQLNLKLNHPT
jgi:hypothetical protein